MSRLVVEKNGQRNFLFRIRNDKKLQWNDIARICGVSNRTVRDWANERYKIRYEAVLDICAKTGARMPDNIKTVLSEHWNATSAAHKGALARYARYGNLGTRAGRKRGGLISQQKFSKNPEYAKKIGFNIRKDILYPSHSELLAEFIGIVLGDGGITDYQVRVTFNRVTDRLYSKFIQKIVRDLFNLPTAIVRGKIDKGDNIVMSSKSLVSFMMKNGLKIGSKIRNKADVPKWILERDAYKAACLRGLVDTDGSFYAYKHKVDKKIYTNFSICFTNHSKPLLDSFQKALSSFGFNPVRYGVRVYLHKSVDVARYFDIIGSSNPKHIKKYKNFYGEVPKRS